MADTRHLAELLQDYDLIRDLIETCGDMEQMRQLESNRMITHDMIIEEVQRLGYEVRTREDALWIARQIV